jgi:AcrR family transcriptional regulator
VSSRDRIDDAALRLLALHGYAGFGMQALADDVGLHKSSLFHHYKSKSDIAAEAVRRVMGRLAEIAETHLLRDPPELDHFVLFSQELCSYFASEPYAAKLLLRVVLAPDGSALQIIESDHPFYVLMTTLVRWCDRARRAGVIRWVRIRHTLFDLMGAAVFHPAAAPQMAYLAGDDPFSEEETAKRHEEIAAFIRGALAPPS